MIQRRTSRFPYLMLLAFLLAAVPAFAQNPLPPQPGGRRVVGDESLMADRARRAEQMGDYSRALAIWQEVLNRNPWQAEALRAVARLLIVLKQYDQADSFITDKIARGEFRGQVINPADPTSRFSLTLLRAQVMLARGDEAAAQKLWTDALAQTGRAPQAVHALAVFLQQNRRWEESEKLIREYRKTEKQPTFMALELANGLRSQMNFLAATEELLLYAATAPAGWQLAMSYLNQYPDDPDVAAKVSGVLQKAAKADRKNPTIWEIVSGYALKTGDFAGSLRAAVTADSLTAHDGSLILANAEQLLNAGEANVAREGFQQVLAWKAVPELAARAELGLGRCSEILSQWVEAKRAYENFVTRYPRTRESDEARFRISEILLLHERNPQAALEILTSLARGPVKSGRVVLRIGDCYSWMGDFNAALQSWSEQARPGSAGGEETTQALLRMARANIWRDSTALANLLLDSVMTMNPANTSFNDAVLYSALLEDGSLYQAQRAFALADYADFRNDDSTAAVQFSVAADLVKEGRLAEWARYAQAEALRGLGKPNEAIAALDSFIARYPESVDFDRAEYTRAIIRTEDLHDDKTALSELEQFLAAHPRSLYLEPARRKARLLQSRAS
jgi:tetratricopeptide (TPR) repeat protein